MASVAVRQTFLHVSCLGSFDHRARSLPSAQDLRIIQRYADLVGQVLASRVGTVLRDLVPQMA